MEVRIAFTGQPGGAIAASRETAAALKGVGTAGRAAARDTGEITEKARQAARE